jgi:parallel beta-helix repeat protein
MPGSINNIILSNNISHNIEGVYLRDSKNNNICGNIIANNWDGILLMNSSNNTIAENILNYNDNGIWLYSSNNNILNRNNFAGNKYDVYTDDADNEVKRVHDLNYPSPSVQEDAAECLVKHNETPAMESCNAASVNVDGWNFTADLSDRWQPGPYELKNDDTAGLSSLLADWTKSNMYIKNFSYFNWKGVVLSNAFILPKEGAVIDFQDIPDPQISSRDEVLANVVIRVHKAPEDIQGLSPQEILADINGYGLTFPKEGQRKKEIDFNGHPALLIEKDYTSDVFDNTYNQIIHAGSTGRISILMNEDTVVSIDVVTRKESGLHAWDIIKKFMIYPTY